MIDGLNWVKERGRKLGIIGTPNFFVQGKLVKKELAIEDIRAMVDPLIAGAIHRGSRDAALIAGHSSGSAPAPLRASC